MTPAARLSAAIEILDRILVGDPATLVLTNWGRQSRYAGSRDRAAVRDIVYDCLRKKRSYAAPFHKETGRALVISHAAETTDNWQSLFSGEMYAPDPLSDEELSCLGADQVVSDAVRLNYPDFLDREFRRSLGDSFDAVMSALAERAPVDLRVNAMRASTTDAISILAADEIEVVEIDGLPNGLRVVQNPRRIAGSQAYRRGIVELQDASSQAVALFSEAAPGMSILDYCAGGGGKSLALFDMIQGAGRVVAHDIASVRMNDLPARAARAHARISIAQPGHAALKPGAFDVVFVDAPCSGTGSWRRKPDAKWRISEGDLSNLDKVQPEILERAAGFLKPDGRLIYATCSLLARENEDRVKQFIATNPSYRIVKYKTFLPNGPGDGFFVAWVQKG